MPLKTDQFCEKWSILWHRGMDSGGVSFLSKTDEICINNEEFCIKNEEFCINNEELCIQNDELCIQNGGLCRPRISPARTTTILPGRTSMLLSARRSIAMPTILSRFSPLRPCARSIPLGKRWLLPRRRWIPSLNRGDTTSWIQGVKSLTVGSHARAHRRNNRLLIHWYTC